MLIATCLVFGVFALWIVTVGWVLELIAWVILFGMIVLGVAAGIRVHKALDKFPNWARMTAAIILGLTITGLALELTHLHTN